jgi:hypothetical protein
MSRKSITRASLALALCAATSTAARASCMLEGREYPEDATVCSGGLALFCSNGTWQNNEGQRCDAPSGNYLGPRRPLQERNPEPVPDFYKEKYPGLNLQ